MNEGSLSIIFISRLAEKDIEKRLLAQYAAMDLIIKGPERVRDNSKFYLNVIIYL